MNATLCLRRMFRQRRGRDIIVAVYKAGKANAIWSWLVPLLMPVDIDTSNGIVAKWHDESHWNRYLSVTHLHW